MKRFALLLCFLVSILNAFSQQDIFIRTLNLSPGTARSITQDKDGYMWFGVSDEVSRIYKYDGNVLKTYTHNPNDSNSLTKGFIRDLFADDSGMIWIATFGNGIDRFNPYNEEFTHFRYNAEDPTGISNDTVYFVTGDKSGNLWMGTKAGLNKYNPSTGKFTNYRHNPNDAGSISHNSVFAIHITKQNEIWLGTFNGLNLLNNETGTFTRYNNLVSQYNLLSDTVTAIQVDSKGTLWLGTTDSHLYSFDKKTKQFTYHPYDKNNPEKLSAPPVYYKSSNYIPFIIEDSDENLWIGSMNGGMNRYDPSTQKTTHYGVIMDENYQVFNSNTDNYKGLIETYTPCLFQSNDGMIWTGSYSGVIYNLMPQNKQIPYEKINTIAVNSFYEDPSGGLWIALQEGLLHQPKNGSQVLYKNIPGNKNSLNHNIINSIRGDEEGNLWLGTGKGIDKFNPKTKEFTHHIINKTDDSIYNVITLMYIDEEDNLWAATNNGLGKINMKTGNVTNFHHDPENPNSLIDNEVYTVIGKENTIWVGTINGLDKYDKSTEKWTHYLPANTILSNIYDSRGVYWVGTTKGLYTYDEVNDIFKLYKDEGTGISIGTVLSVIEDNNQNLWASSIEKIFKINTANNEIQVFGSGNGIHLNGLLLADNILNSEGNLILGDEFGYYKLNPNDYKPGPKPLFHISSLSLGYKEVVPGKNSPIAVHISKAKDIHLASNQNSFSFEFKGITFMPTETISFRYKMDNTEWQDLGIQNIAHFFNLSPGDYVLRVRAVSNSGAWSEKSINIHISTPWWQTWWGILLLIIALALIISLFSYYRSKQLIRQNKVLEEKVNHRTLQLKNSIENLKATQSQLIQSEKMASLGELTAGIAHEIQNPLNFINNFSEINKELLTEMNEEIENGNLDAIKDIAKDIRSNEEKIYHHGHRADGIVKSMLQHSRINSSATKEPVDINKLADEYLRLAYHGLRAKDKSFNSGMKTDFDENLPPVSIVPQDIGRVILNLLTNALYAVNEKSKALGEDYKPMVTISTKKIDDKAKIVVSDNGFGIPENIIDKIFQPFFTTKPAGQGTGLGLSMSYDIITKSHGGELQLNSREGEGTEFSIILPIKQH